MAQTQEGLRRWTGRFAGLGTYRWMVRKWQEGEMVVSCAAGDTTSQHGGVVRCV